MNRVRFSKGQLLALRHKPHTVDVDKREVALAVVLDAVQHVGRVEVDVEHALLVQTCHEACKGGSYAAVELLGVV